MMQLTRKEPGATALRALFETGTMVGLTDGQLLERFARGRGESSQAALLALAALSLATIATLITGLAIGHGVAQPQSPAEKSADSPRPQIAKTSEPKPPMPARSWQEGRQQPQPKETPELTKTFAPAFRALHDHIRQVYPGLRAKGIDWAKVVNELEPRAAKAKTLNEFGLLVEELVARMEDSHAVVLAGSATPPRPELPQWGPGIACLIDDKGLPVVYSIDRGSSAQHAGITRGMTIVSINGIAAADAMRAWMEQTRRYYGYSSERTLKFDAARSFLCQAKRATRIKLKTRDVNGRELTLDLIANRNPRPAPKLPVPRDGINENANLSWTRLDNAIGYIYIRRIQTGLEGSLDQALIDLGDIKGLIIDVRGNTGGGFDTSTAFLNFDRSQPKAEKPQRPKYVGPIAMLIDERCISAGEGWTSWFVAQKRARLFGTTTAGASSRKETYTLTNGLFRVVVPVKAYTGFLDRPIERQGIEPNVEVRCTASDLARGRDTVALAAAAWLAGGGKD